MSGIAGTVRLHDSPARSGTIEAMAYAIAHRGDDAPRIWSNANVALAHAALHTTPQSRGETQPVDDDALAIVADVRLDHRSELVSLLGLEGRQAGDAALLLAAYRRWGRGLVSRIEGDFAFAIWNGRERELFCARDPFGVRQLVYAHVPGRLFAFASEARALLAVDEIPGALDERRIADFLAVYFDDPARTFHREVRRLPGGCTLTLRDGAVRIDRYWSPQNVAPLRLRGGDRDMQYAQGFRTEFERAMRERMRAGDPKEIGAMLSGGLDSTSIACMARDELRASGAGPLPVFSWVFSDSRESDEREYQEAAIAAGGMEPVVLDSALLHASPWTDLDALLPDGPPYAPNHYLNHVAARHARERGIRVLLDGTGGDSTISRGRSRYHELFFRGRIPTLARELRAQALRRGTSESLPHLFASSVAGPLMPPSLLRAAQRLRGRRIREWNPLAILTPRMRSLGGPRSPGPRWHFSTRAEHLSHLESPLLADGLELLDHSMAMHGVEGRYPFFDRRLTEYCISLPGDQKLAGGYSRIVARRAMEGVVPDMVRWRAGKGQPGLHVITALRQSREMLDDVFVRDPSALEPYVEIDVLRTLYAELLSGRAIDFRTVVQLWSAAVLAVWLRDRASRQNFL